MPRMILTGVDQPHKGHTHFARVPSVRLSTYFLLICIVVAGAGLRVWQVNFDQGLGSHPDERSTSCFYATQVHLPQSWDEFWDPQRSPMNPLWDLGNQQRRSFTYGHYPLYLGVATGNLMHKLAPPAERFGAEESAVALMQRANSSCDAMAVAGRLTIAFHDIITIILLFLLGLRIYGQGAGLIAAAFYAFTAQAIQLSHFFAMDPASTTYTVLAVLGGVMMVQERSLRAALITGIAAGLAIASKFSALPILAVPITAAILIVWREQLAGRAEHRPADTRGQLYALLTVPLILLLAGLTFFITSPYAVLDRESFIQATLIEQGRMVRGIADFPFTRQYRNTTPYLYFLEQQLEWGLWWPLGIVTAIGVLYALLQLLYSMLRLLIESFIRDAKHSRWQLSEMQAANIVLWSWVVPYFGLTGAFLAKFNRYMSPLLPFAVFFAAGLIWALWQWGTRRNKQTVMGESSDDALLVEQTAGEPGRQATPLRWITRPLAIILTLTGLIGGIFWSAAYVNGVYNQEHTWITASRWIAENVPAGSVILCEQWDDCLPWNVPNEPEANAVNSQLRRIDWGPYEEDTAEKYELLKAKLRETDYVIYSSKRIYDSVDELPERYPMTIRYYNAMFDGSLGFELANEVTTPPQLFGYVFDDRHADESWSLYDHAQVAIFRKVRDLSDAEFDAIFARSWEMAIPWYRGADSPLSPLLNRLGLGNTPESEGQGLINRFVALFSDQTSPTQGQPEERPSLRTDIPLAELPVVDNYRWNQRANENAMLAVLWWWFVLALLGWSAWPLAFWIFQPLRDRGYFLSRALGWLVAGWLLWWLASLDLAMNSVVNSWLTVAILALFGCAAAIRQWTAMRAFLRTHWLLLLSGEILFAVAYGGFILLRMGNPDLWQLWFGGEKFMEFAMLNGILRSPTFPPVDPHFAGGIINYYYFGLYLVAYLIKLTGIYAEVAFNLAIPSLFALTVINAFAVAYSATAQSDTMQPDRDSAGEIDEAEAELRLDREPLGSEGLAEAKAASPSTSPSTGSGRSSASAISASSGSAVFLNTPLTSPDDEVINSAESSDGTIAAMSPLQDEAQADAGLEADLDMALDIPAEDIGPTPVVAASPTLTGVTETARTAAPSASPLSWYTGFLAALLAPFFVTVIGNLDGMGQMVQNLANMGPSQFQSELPLLQPLVRAASGLRIVLTTPQTMPNYDFWGPSRVIPDTINEFPYWSFLFADLHPHLIGIPLAVLFLALVLTLFREMMSSQEIKINRAFVFLLLFSLLLGAQASVNLWELPTYLGLGVLALMIAQFRRSGKINWVITISCAIAYLAAAYVLYWPFFSNYVNVGASGVGAVKEGDPPSQWLAIWGLFAFVLFSWLIFAATRPAQRGRGIAGQTTQASGVERWLGGATTHFDRFPRFVALHRVLVKGPTLGYLLTTALISLAAVAALGAWFWGRTILALCLLPLGLAWLLLWRRGRAADAGSLFIALLTITGFAVLAGTQVVYLKDFLQGGSAYRMNTVFKFFSQVWVIWGIAAAIAVPRLWRSFVNGGMGKRFLRGAWAFLFLVLFAASFAYPVWGTPARLDMRFPGWRPDYGTLNGLDFMREGRFDWPDPSNTLELTYDWQAIQWILANVRGNVTIVESSQVAYYREAGSRIASMTGLSGITGMHEGEQRYGEDVGLRGAQHREFWETPDVGRIEQLINELQVDLIYVGPLELYLHPGGVDRLEELAVRGALEKLFTTDRSTIYAVPGRLGETAEGYFVPIPN